MPHDEKAIQRWSPEEDAATMKRLHKVEKHLIAEGKLGPVARLQPTPTARTLRRLSKEQFLIDGPFAETKEPFLGFFVVEVETLDDAIAAARDLAARALPSGRAGVSCGSCSLEDMTFAGKSRRARTQCSFGHTFSFAPGMAM